MVFHFLSNFFFIKHLNEVKHDNSILVNLSDRNVKGIKYCKSSLPSIYNAMLQSLPVYVLYDDTLKVKQFLKEFMIAYGNGGAWKDIDNIIELNLGLL